MDFTLEEKKHLKDINIVFIENPLILKALSSIDGGIEFKVEKKKGTQFKLKVCLCGCVTLNMYARLDGYYSYNECPICANKNYKKITAILNESNNYTFNLHDKYSFTKIKEKVVVGEKVISKLKLNIKMNDKKVDSISFDILEDKSKNNKIEINLESEKPSDFYVIYGKDKKSSLEKYMNQFLTDDVVLEFLIIYNEIFRKTDLYVPIIPRIDKFVYLKMLLNYELKLVNEFFQTDVSSVYLSKSKQLPIKSNNQKLKEDLNKRNLPTILETPKSVLKEIKKYADKVVTLETKTRTVYDCLNISKEFKDLPPENIIKLIQLYKDNRGMGTNFIQEFRYLLNNGHKFNQLLYYLYNAKEKQHIAYMGNVINYYYDYVRMSNEISVPYTKYPKNLVKVHDVRAKDFNALLNNKKDEKFIEVYKEYNYLNKENIVDNYVFIAPKVINDLIFEGQKLNHCVSSYASLILNKESIIFFMRRKESQNKPLVTIEIKLDTKEVVQARGSYNRRLNDEENKILNKWITKNLK